MSGTLLPRMTLLLAGSLIACAIGACGAQEGQSERDAETTVERFLGAVESSDAAVACEQLAEPTLADLEAAGGCEQVLDEGIDLLGSEEVSIPDYEIAAVLTGDDTAEATLKSTATDDTLELVREGERWKLQGTTALSQLHPDHPLAGTPAP